MNLRDNDGRSALMAAAEPCEPHLVQNYAQVLRLLPQAGAQKDFRDTDGHTAQTLAKQDEQHELVQLLLEAGAST